MRLSIDAGKLDASQAANTVHNAYMMKLSHTSNGQPRPFVSDHANNGAVISGLAVCATPATVPVAVAVS